MPDKQFKPAIPLPSATVILLRERAGRIQIFLLRRHAGSGFMAGNYVFPGGMVDPGDCRIDFWQNHVDQGPSDITRRLGGGIETGEIIAHGVAAVRETFEEAGVFLAGKPGQAPGDIDRIQKIRNSGRMPEDWLIAEVTAGDWVIAFSALRRWAHWVTPERMQRRFDTLFFMARMPSDQRCRPDHIETVHGIWATVEQALDGNMSGQTPLSPPTLMTLHEILPYRSLADLWAEARKRTWGAVRMPRFVPHRDATLILRPEDPDYSRSQIKIRADQLNRSRLSVGEPFTRLWLKDGLWLPVGR